MEEQRICDAGLVIKRSRQSLCKKTFIMHAEIKHIQRSKQKYEESNNFDIITIDGYYFFMILF